MALADLRNTEMVSLTSSWADPEHDDRRALERVPELASFMPHVDRAHTDVLAAQFDLEASRLAGISRAQMHLYKRLGGLIHSAWNCLEMYRKLAVVQGDESEAERLLDLQDVIFPDRLKVIQYSYREISGYAELLAARLDRDDRQVLKRLPVGKKNLLDLIEQWFVLARELGELENQRSQRRSDERRSSNMSARNAWIRMVKMVRMMLEVVDTDDEDIANIMRSIDAAEQAAGLRRMRASNSGADDSDVPTDGVDEPAEPADPMSADPDAAHEPGMDHDFEDDFEDSYIDSGDHDRPAGGMLNRSARGPDSTRFERPAMEADAAMVSSYLHSADRAGAHSGEITLPG